MFFTRWAAENEIRERDYGVINERNEGKRVDGGGADSVGMMDTMPPG